MPNIGDIKLDCSAWLDPNTDTVKVKVRRFDKDEDGRVTKRGVMFRFSEEMLMNIAEGMEYPILIPQNVERFVQVADEINE